MRNAFAAAAADAALWHHSGTSHTNELHFPSGAFISGVTAYKGALTSFQSSGVMLAGGKLLHAACSCILLFHFHIVFRMHDFLTPHNATACC